MSVKDTSVEHAMPSHKRMRKLVERFRVTSGDKFKLKQYPTDDPAPDLIDHEDADACLRQGVERLSNLQESLYASRTFSLLIIFQAMDAAGKDGTIKHVMSGVNPQGVAVTSFGIPGPEDLAHDFLWRISRALPARGMIGICNRSHYEEVLVTRVHPDLLDKQHLPKGYVDKKRFWDDRLEDIAGFERHLDRQGTKILKFFLNISRDEQKKRLLARLDTPGKTWKFNSDDLRERALWKDYMHAYESAIAATAAPDAPWFVVPADQKWFSRLVVVEAINDALSALDLKPPAATPEEMEQFAQARARLETDT